VRKRLRALPENAVVLFEDETDLLLFPPLWAGWAKRGSRKTVLLSGYNKRQVVFGALNIKSGYLLLQPYERQRALEFQDFLDVVRWHYRMAPIAMVLDGDPSHIAKESQEYASDHEIELCWLPVRSPELNPLERLWRKGKMRVCANHQYRSIEEQTERFMSCLLARTADETLLTSGVASDEFWVFR
jgi:hypothetical protein